MKAVLITGAEGFVGRELVQAMRTAGIPVLAQVRVEGPRASKPDNTVCVADLREPTDWRTVLAGVGAVVHLAARAHVVTERARNPIEAFRAANVVPTLSLFKSCQAAGVKRFVYVSSIGVNGVATFGKPFRNGDAPNPIEPYAISKWEAEQGLRSIAMHGHTELVIVRPTIIYGPYVKGNFLRLLRLVNSGLPLPFRAISSMRSILSLASFCDLLIRCTFQPEAAGQMFLASDVEPIATCDLVVAIADLMERRARLVSIPPRFLNVIGRLSGFGPEVSRMIGSLEVDSSVTRQTLCWMTDTSFQFDMKRMVNAFLQSRNV